MKTHAFLIILAVANFSSSLGAEVTHVAVRVLAKDSKFIGSSMEGAHVTISEKDSNKILAQGITRGDTGDTHLLMHKPRSRYKKLATKGSAVFFASIKIDVPTQVRITARGPLVIANPQEVSITQWLFPKKHLDKGDGIVLELPGFAIEPQPLVKIPRAGSEVEVHAIIRMMCGCPIEPGGIWDSDEISLWATVERKGEILVNQPLTFVAPSDFMLRFIPANEGEYTITFFALDKRTANTGLGKMSLSVIADES